MTLRREWKEGFQGGDRRFKNSETGEGAGCLRHGAEPGKSRDTEGQEVSRDPGDESRI